ncbi:tRNA (adenosine(37)-N6)-threonylcarbamoyltransferase complex dimerization subunit type 1 TsaB [uncultured Tateyamaria sp.]|uniref:tRNA (adenosine(37)-N6)-threonylcarbamoyltransferase complex dimerization subunit type 1 TsaB n=1 Tax=Tateyamaria sp. 1078 TaxID=3417464 RepID=UPI00261836CF|nr:tRNA (adenosine(37)-N6)-threonylcarbamoyltransferase complex dimerization subunit type 1 TsaB [uncultured Tateyamaria sp.]
MNDAPLVLGFDTTAAHCAAAVVRGDRLLASTGEDMARGQAERLMDMLQEVLDTAAVQWSDLSALAVGVGPGNFTGIRIGVSAARGLALGLGIPAYGVDGFDVRARTIPHGSRVIIPAPRDMVYVRDAATPSLVPRQSIDNAAPDPTPQALAQAIAAIGAERWPASPDAPAPLYVKAPDAAPARDVPPPLLP